MKKINNGWFTLIEVLIAIIILAMSVVLILGIITNIQRLRATAYSKTISTMLAKEGMELFYNNRDSNLMNWGRDLPWDCIFVDNQWRCDSPEQKLSPWKYIVSILKDWWYEIKKNWNSQLYICNIWDVNIYTNDSNGWSDCKLSDFKRYINISAYQNNNQTSQNIYNINSIVEYNKNWFRWEVNLQSTIGNI